MPTATAVTPTAETNKDGRPRNDEDALVRTYLPLVNYAVSEMATKVPRHVSRDDLASAGMAGLAQAARSFDASRGISFERYATTRIKGSLLDELRDRDWASRSVRAKARQMAAVTENLTARLGRGPSTNEVAKAMGMAPSAIDSIAEDVHRAVILNFDALPVDGNAEDFLLSPDRSPDDVVLDRERKGYMAAAVTNLPERLRRVVIGYFFEEQPMQALADELGVTESRISQMRAEALALLRDGINSQLDPDLVIETAKTSRVTRRKNAYYAAVANHTDYRDRLAPSPFNALVNQEARIA
jgi:RNA polymerase sigma factor for flagellar operon FliA